MPSLQTFNRSSPCPRLNQRQRGVGFISFIVLVIVVCAVAVLGIKVFPTFVEYRAIMSAVKKSQAAANSVVEIQKSFDRYAAIDNIDAIVGKDLDITRVNDEFVVSFAYTKKIPLIEPVSLVIDYKGNNKGL